MRECLSATKPVRRATSTLATESMDHAVNEFGQPIGFPLPDWRPPPHPPREPMVGRYCRLEPLQPESTRLPCTRHMPVTTRAGPTCPVARSPRSKATETGQIPFLRPMTPCSSRSSTRPSRSEWRVTCASCRRPVRSRSVMSISRRRKAVSGCHRGHVSDDGIGVPTGIPPLRVEMRRPERSFACGGAATRILLRGYDSPGDGLQGSQPRYGVVFNHRHRMAGSSWSVRGVARSGQLRFGRPATQSVVRPDLRPESHA